MLMQNDKVSLLVNLIVYWGVILITLGFIMYAAFVVTLVKHPVTVIPPGIFHMLGGAGKPKMQ